MKIFPFIRDAQGATWEIIQNVSKLHGRFSSSITKLKSIVQAEKDLAGGKVKVKLSFNFWQFPIIQKAL